MARRFKGDVLIENDLDISNELGLSAETAERALQLDASGKVKSSSVTSTELGYLSGVSSAIQTQLDAKLDDFSSSNDNRIVRTDGTGGDAIQESGITIDDSDNITGVNDLTVGGDLTVNGTTTTINTTNLDVEDANITVNNGGNQASADSADAGFTVEMSDATDAFIGYDSTTTSKFLVGEVGSGAEIASVSHTQTLQNKTIDGTAASGNNTVTTDADQVTYERADGSKKNIDAGSDEVESALSDLDDAIGALEASPTNYTPSDASIVADHLAGIDTALAATADELVKGSANDTTAGYLEDKIVVSSGANASTILEVSTLNDGGDEDVQIQIDESRIDHDALTNFVANEHIDHSGVSVVAGGDDGLVASNDDLTSNIGLAVDIDGTTAETTNDDADTILIYDDSASALRKMTRANFLSGIDTSSAGDISETSFSGANNQASAANVTGLAFANGTVRSFEAQISIVVDADSDLYEVYTLQGVQRGADWVMDQQSTGDDTNVNFTITTAGQIQYTSDTYAGFVSLTMKFRAQTTTV